MISPGSGLLKEGLDKLKGFDFSEYESEDDSDNSEEDFEDSKESFSDNDDNAASVDLFTTARQSKRGAKSPAGVKETKKSCSQSQSRTSTKIPKKK